MLSWCFLCCFHVSPRKKKLDRGGGGLVGGSLTNPSFSRIFGFFIQLDKTPKPFMMISNLKKSFGLHDLYRNIAALYA